MFERIEIESRAIAARTETAIRFESIDVTAEPAPTDPRVRKLIAQSAEELGLSYEFMPSGAGHDAQDIAEIAPIGMIFVPSVGGISHSPKEYTSPEDMANGANVLLHTILRIDQNGL